MCGTSARLEALPPGPGTTIPTERATKHAAARRCTVSLALHDERLLLTVDDDGVGLRTGTYGVGTLSMIERATAIGGTCRLETSPCRSVRVAAGLPVTQSTTPSSRQEVTQ